MYSKFIFVAATLGMAALHAEAQSFSVAAAKPRALTASAIAVAEKKASGAAIASDKQSLIVAGKSARIIIRTGPESDMMSYRIKGLRNPTLSVAAGAKLSILFINADGDMLHNLRFTAKKSPYPAKPGSAGSSGSADLAHAKGAPYSGQELMLIVPKQKGIYAYVCTIPGHAAAGMSGKLIVR